MNILKDTLAKDFQFETDSFEIPSERWETALQKKVADFVHEYDSPDCMVIIYYAGHAYIGGDTGKLKVAAYAVPISPINPMCFKIGFAETDAEANNLGITENGQLIVMGIQPRSSMMFLPVFACLLAISSSFSIAASLKEPLLGNTEANRSSNFSLP